MTQKLTPATSFAIRAGKDWDRSTAHVDRFEWRCFGLSGCQTGRRGYLSQHSAYAAAGRHLEQQHAGSRQLADWTGDNLSDGHGGF